MGGEGSHPHPNSCLRTHIAGGERTVGGIVATIPSSIIPSFPFLTDPHQDIALTVTSLAVNHAGGQGQANGAGAVDTATATLPTHPPVPISSSDYFAYLLFPITTLLSRPRPLRTPGGR